MDLYIGMSKPQRIKTLRIPKIQYILWIFQQESIFFSDEHFLKNRNTLTRVKFRDDKESYWLVIRMLLAILRSRLCTLRTSAQLLLTTLLYWLAWALSFFSSRICRACNNIANTSGDSIRIFSKWCACSFLVLGCLREREWRVSSSKRMLIAYRWIMMIVWKTKQNWVSALTGKSMRSIFRNYWLTTSFSVFPSHLKCRSKNISYFTTGQKCMIHVAVLVEV